MTVFCERTVRVWETDMPSEELPRVMWRRTFRALALEERDA